HHGQCRGSGVVAGHPDMGQAGNLGPQPELLRIAGRHQITVDFKRMKQPVHGWPAEVDALYEFARRQLEIDWAECREDFKRSADCSDAFASFLYCRHFTNSLLISMWFSPRGR